MRSGKNIPAIFPRAIREASADMTKLVRFVSEIRNLFFALDARSFFRWIWLLLLLLPKVVRTRSLGAVDEAFGPAVRFRTGGREFSLERCSLGLVREIIGSACYARPDELRDCRAILDLGSNCGVFTLFCLANAPDARVVAVEAQPGLVADARANMQKSGFAGSAEFVNAFVGESNEFIRTLAGGDPSVGQFSPESYIAQVGGCDFMKCDVEGAEYSLITPSALWLRRVNRISLEYHGIWEQGAGLGEILRGHGFMVSQHPHGSLGYLQGARSASRA